jgi:hypothetical protein
MESAHEDEAEVEAREKAAMLLRDRHQRESEALAALIAADSRRAAAQEVVERATGQIESRLAELSRLGFDNTTLAELGIDIADLRGTRASRRQERTVEETQVATEPSPEMGTDGDAGPETGADKHAVGVRTTAHLASLSSPPGGVTNRPRPRVDGHVEPGTAPTR